jgi:hypothetical protein
MHDHGVDADALQRLHARLRGELRGRAPEEDAQERRVGDVAVDDRLEVVGREVLFEGLLADEPFAVDGTSATACGAVSGQPPVDRRHLVPDRDALR